MKVTKPCTLTLADLCTRKVAAMIEKEKVFMGSFTKTFSALPIIAHPSFSGSPPSLSLSSCVVKLAMTRSWSIGKLMRPLAIVAQYVREGGRKEPDVASGYFHEGA